MTTDHSNTVRPRVMVLGGTGFVGRHLIPALQAGGYDVSVPSRQPDQHRNGHELAGTALLHLDLDTLATAFGHDGVSAANTLVQALSNHSALINLVGILHEPRHNGETFQRVHVDLAMMALQAARQAGVSRYLHMSALGASATHGASFYQRSKGEAEDAVHAFGARHGIAVTSVRPSVIFGPGDSFLNRFAGLARWTPGIFPLACAQARFAPVYVGDVCAKFVEALASPTMVGQRIDLCGPADYSLRELVAYAARQAGHPRWVLPLPDFVARLQARVLEHVPGKPFTRDNYASMKTHNVCGDGEARQPTRLEDIAPSYLRT